MRQYRFGPIPAQAGEPTMHVASGPIPAQAGEPARSKPRSFTIASEYSSGLSPRRRGNRGLDRARDFIKRAYPRAGGGTFGVAAISAFGAA